ncbi:MAG: putative periplasmic protein, partial [Abditibacteriota bacterium]|nr:putative periplasmic protein [Abditibacteriota bacterium]
MHLKYFAGTLLVLPFFATTTLAQAPTSPATPSTTQTPTSPDSSSQAGATLTKDEAAPAKLLQMVAAYSALKSFAATVELQQTVTTAGQPAGSAPVQRARVQWQRPNRVRVVTRNPSGEEGAAKAISNGTNIFVAYSFAPGQYVKRPVPPTEAIQQTVLAGGAAGPGAVLAFGSGGKAQLETFFKTARSYSLGAAETLNGTPTETVIVQMPFRDSAMRYTFSLGQKDHLLRRLKLDYAGREGSIAVVETHSELQINPQFPASTWAYVPPKGAKATTTLEPLT